MWQPHGSLLVTGAKIFETRGWSTKFRGPLLIHAAQRYVKREMEIYLGLRCYQRGLAPLLGLPLNLHRRPARIVTIDDLPFGAIIGICELVDCIPVEKLTKAQRRAAKVFGDFSPGRFAWRVGNVRRLREPVPWPAKQGFFYAAIGATPRSLIPVR